MEFCQVRAILNRQKYIFKLEIYCPGYPIIYIVYSIFSGIATAKRPILRPLYMSGDCWYSISLGNHMQSTPHQNPRSLDERVAHNGHKSLAATGNGQMGVLSSATAHLSLYDSVHIYVANPLSHPKLMVSCQKGPTRHAYAWQIGPFWQDTLKMLLVRPACCIL